MRKFLTLILFVALSGFGSQLAAQNQPQNQPSTQPQQPAADQPSTQPQQSPADQPSTQPQQPQNQPGSQAQQPTAEQPGSQPQPVDGAQPSAETFRGKIARAGNQFVFQEAKSQTTFQIDDQARVAPYEGKSVKLTATVDAKTSSLHVVDIAPSDK